MPVGWNWTELHVDQVGPGPQGEGMAVAGVLPGVGGDLPGLAVRHGGQHHRLGPEHDQAARLAPVGDSARDPVIILEQAHHRALHEHLDAGGHGPVLEGPDHLQAGAVADVGQAGEAVAAEVALEDAAVVGAVEQAPPLLQLVDPVGHLLGVELGHAPAVEHLAAAHGVAEVHRQLSSG